MKTFILLFGILLSFSSFAQWRHDNHFSYPTGTMDGNVRISSMAPLSAGVKWVRVYITGNGKTEDSFYSVSEGERFDKSIPLRHGRGSYTFQIMTSKSDMKYSQYAVEHQGTFINSSSEVLDAIAPSCDVQSDAPEIVALAESIIQGLQTEMDKAAAIHDWVASNIAYDVDSYFQGTYAQKEWDALTVLRSGKAICAGYSNLTAALNRAAGLESKVVIGDAKVYQAGWTAHAWNEVKVDGRWVAQDTTWDAGSVDFVKKTFTFRPGRKYFNPSPEEFAKDHRPQ